MKQRTAVSVYLYDSKEIYIVLETKSCSTMKQSPPFSVSPTYLFSSCNEPEFLTNGKYELAKQVVNLYNPLVL